MVKVHSEPLEFRMAPPERCVVCNKPTRTWYLPDNAPVCMKCAVDATPESIHECKIK